MLHNSLLNPKSILVVGASNDPKKPGGSILKNLLNGRFTGKLYAANPKETSVQGVSCIDLRGPLPDIDLAIIAISVKFIKETIENLVRNNIKSYIVLSAGFSETGALGQKLEGEVTAIVNQANASMIGPNCIGVLTPSYCGVFAGPIPKLELSGCDFVSQSGATAAFIMEMGIELGISFASCFSVGNSAQIGVEEVVQYWDENFDPESSSKIKLLYLENIRKPKLLLKHAASLVNKGCKIAAIKSGNSDAGTRAASSHTGALANSDTAVQSLFDKAGIVRCHGREDLLHTASIFSYPKLEGKNVAIVTHAGGPGVMITDTLSKMGINIPHLTGEAADELKSFLAPGSSVANPIDILATGTAEHAAKVMDYLEHRFDNIDGIVFIYGQPGPIDIKPVYKMLAERIKTYRKPIYPILPSLTTGSKDIEYFKSFGYAYFPDEVAFGRCLGVVEMTPSPVKGRETSFLVDREKLKEITAKNSCGYLPSRDVGEMLDGVNIARVDEQIVDTLEGARRFSKKHGFSLVMKAIGPLHKSDIGGVALNIDNDQKLQREFERLMGIKDVNSVLIQPMLSGTELFIGAKREPNFGHVILVGLGGIYVEVFKDVKASLAPLRHDEALRMIKGLQSYPLIQGARGRQSVSEAEFADMIVKLSLLVENVPEISELDINPLIGTKDGIRAVDARIRIEKDL